MATIVNAAPCAGKTTIKTYLEGYKVTCVDMSDLIKQASENNPSLASTAKKLALAHQLLPCDITMDIFTDFIIKNQNDRMVFFGVPRTDFQARVIANHEIFMKFDILRVLDVSVEIPIIEQRYNKRKSKENRPDDNVDWSVFKRNRVDTFHDSRHSILKVFTHHDNWHVKCVCGDAKNAALDVANGIVTSMKLCPR